MTAQRLSFTKMHGCGNDYIYVNTYLYKVSNPEELSQKLSRPHFGVGSDGLVLIGPPSDGVEADLKMRIFNADGSEALMCGNASRCVGKYAYERGLTDSTQIRLETASGIKILSLTVNQQAKVESVSVDMGTPCLHDSKLYEESQGKTLQADDRTFTGTFVSMGNPHFVIFLDEDLDQFNISYYGKLLEHHPAFPQRCNIEFVQAISEGIVRARVWERGSGITMACGTGSCAVAVATHLAGKASRDVTVKMDGGDLRVNWQETDNHVFLTGPAEFVFEGQVDLPQ